MQTCRVVQVESAHISNIRPDIRSVHMTQFSEKPDMIVKSGNAVIKIYSPIITEEESNRRWKAVELEVYRQYLRRQAKIADSSNTQEGGLT